MPPASSTAVRTRSLSADKRIGNSGSQRPEYEPTPEQIRAECEKIRAGWSEAAWARARARYGVSGGRSERQEYRFGEMEYDD